MLRSMFSGISGLRTHQTKLDVIGNNIANVNTVGFKASRTVFQEIYSQTLKSASAPSGGGARGGANPQQVGLGVSIASIDVLHTNNGVQRTDKATDLAIEGDGFFVVSDGVSNFYTRAGNFDIDAQGYLVSSGGLKVQGWTERDADGNIIPTGSTKEINLANLSMPPKATSEIIFSGNLDSRTEVGKTVEYTTTIVDSLGEEHNIVLTFTKEGTDADGDTTWNLTVTLPEITDSDGNPEVLLDDGEIQFDANGNIIPADPDDEYVEITLDFGSVDFDNGATVGNDNDEVAIKFDLEKTTQHARESSLKVTETDGYGPGTLDDVSIDSGGRVIGIYSNGQARIDAILAIARFSNPAGLTKLGSNLFQISANSGEPEIGEAGVNGRGDINPGALEMSNVNLANEFTEMIIAQRGFQANSRIITTSDELLQELVNLKR